MSKIGYKLPPSKCILATQYLTLVESQQVIFHDSQYHIMQLLDALRLEGQRRNSCFYRVLGRWMKYLYRHADGLYLWGGVGVGKTMMMDMFYQSLPFPAKARYHFHDFMQQCHAFLKTAVGKRDPLNDFVKILRRQAVVLCLDEFLVEDIADAMILARLLRLFECYQIILVTTANTEPSQLYAGGLQRAQFLPAIHWIETHLQIVLCDIAEDYRFLAARKAGLYHYPITPQTTAALEALFCHLAAVSPQAHRTPFKIEVNHHAIEILAEAAQMIWLDFKSLCQAARSKGDYLALARRYRVFLLSGIPEHTTWSSDTCKRFIYLVDILYEMKCLLVLQAEEPLEAWKVVGERYPAFERTYSRLQAMQAENLNFCHK